jgi:AmmeMemoRadiSam system protein B/AmmeMemoRadiSam system protein A
MASTESALAEPATARAPRLHLTAEQKRQIVAAAAELVRSAVMAQEPAFADPTLAGAADERVSGAFVSLKRGKHLRSCCGALLEQLVPLGVALRDAAVRTALEDVRFPPVSPMELEHLEMEVWLLHNPTPVTSKGEERVRAVTVGGKHGLVVSRGQSRGLLLPGVAAENNWDARRFLEQTCVKAGLHSSLWKDDETSVLTFEGEALRGRVVSPGPGQQWTSPASWISSHELAIYTDFCRGNVGLLLRGATPNYYLSGASDGHVSGVVLQIRRPGSDPTTLSQFSLRPGVPLQATLFSLAQAAAHALAAQGVQADELDTLQFAMAILHGPAMRGTVASPDLAGIDGQRAILVFERSRAGLVFDQQCAAEELLQEAARQAQVRRPAHAGVFSVEAVTTETRVVVSTAPRPVPGAPIRLPGVSGRFYPANPNDLWRLADELLAGDREARPWPAAMVPHAGLVYSGRVAANVLKRIQIPDTVVVLGPKHTGLGMDWAVAPHQSWALPGCTIAADPDLARQLVKAIPELELDALAHRDEHAIEVELPFLARLAPQARVVGVAIGDGDLESCRRFAAGLAEVVRQQPRPPLLLISSDMNHFATDQETRLLDEVALAALEGLDPEQVYETVTGNGISMCGVLPAVIVLETLRLLGSPGQAERVGYATTADVTGDTSRVVGYAGMLFG